MRTRARKTTHEEGPSRSTAVRACNRAQTRLLARVGPRAPSITRKVSSTKYKRAPQKQVRVGYRATHGRSNETPRSVKRPRARFGRIWQPEQCGSPRGKTIGLEIRRGVVALKRGCRGECRPKRTLAHRLRDPRREPFPFLVRVVLRPRPEEPAQAVALPARDDVHVQVRDALRDLVVDRDEAAVRLERLLHRAGDALHGSEDRRHEWRGERQEVVRVLARNHQDVALEDGSRVQEGADGLLLKDEGGGDLAADDGAEGASRHRAHLTMRASPRRERQQFRGLAGGFPSSRPCRVYCRENGKHRTRTSGRNHECASFSPFPSSPPAPAAAARASRIRPATPCRTVPVSTWALPATRSSGPRRT